MLFWVLAEAVACVKVCLPFRSHISSSGSFSTPSQLRLLGLGDRAGGKGAGAGWGCRGRDTAQEETWEGRWERSTDHAAHWAVCQPPG